MISVGPAASLYPGAVIHWLGSGTVPSTVQLLHTDNPTVALSVIVGDSRDAGHVLAARRIADALQPGTMCLTVMAGAAPEQEGTLIKALGNRCDAMVTAAHGELAAIVNALTGAIMSPLAAGHPWCFDWNDMREICSGSSAPAAARVFIGRARGENAVCELMERWTVASVAGPRKLLVCVGIPSIALIAVHHAVMQALASAGSAGGPAGSGIALDSTLAPDEVALTIIDFGAAPLRPVVSTNGIAQVAMEDLPRFLRYR